MDARNRDRSTLFEVELALAPAADVKALGASYPQAVEEEIKVLSQAPVKAKVFVDRVEDAVAELNRRKLELPPAFSDVSPSEYSFVFASMGCGFLDVPECRVMWARFGVRLYSVPDGTKPAVIHVFPTRVTQPTTLTREKSLEATLGLEIAQVVKPEVSVGVGSSRESVVYQPTVVSYVNQNEVLWTYEAPADSWISGDQEVFFVARRTAASRLVASVVLGVDVRSKWGRIWPLRVRNSKAVESLYQLES